MKFTLENPQADYVFNNYGSGILTVNDQPYERSLLIFPNALTEWPVTSIPELELDHFAAFIDRRPDIIILGTGQTQQFPSIDLRRELAGQQIQLDVMDTAAACRTYNLLVSEDRNVGAAVLVF